MQKIIKNFLYKIKMNSNKHYQNNRILLISKLHELASKEGINMSNEVNNYQYIDDSYQYSGSFYQGESNSFEMILWWEDESKRKQIKIEEVNKQIPLSDKFFDYLNTISLTSVDYWKYGVHEDYYHKIDLRFYNCSLYSKEIFEIYKKFFIENYSVKQMQKLLKKTYYKIWKNYNAQIKKLNVKNWKSYIQKTRPGRWSNSNKRLPPRKQPEMD